MNRTDPLSLATPIPRARLARSLPAHGDAIYACCLKTLGSPQDAADLTQETMLRALRLARRYQPERPPRPWLLSIARNLCLDRRRRVWWRRSEGMKDERLWEGEVDRLLDDRRRTRSLQIALSSIRPIYREALIRHHLGRMTYREMAGSTGVDSAALKQRVRRGGSSSGRSCAPR